MLDVKKKKSVVKLHNVVTYNNLIVVPIKTSVNLFM